jgi:alkylated DNA nucleotide flippase Atl1
MVSHPLLPFGPEVPSDKEDASGPCPRTSLAGMAMKKPGQSATKTTKINPLKLGLRYAWLPVRLLAVPDQQLGRRAKLVYAVLTQVAAGNVAWPTRAEIAQKLGLGKSTRAITDALRELEECMVVEQEKILSCGLITTTKIDGKASIYQFVASSLVTDQPVDPEEILRLPADLRTAAIANSWHLSDVSDPETAFVQLPNWLLRRTELTLGAKLTYCCLAWFLFAKGRSYPMGQTVATMMGAHRASVCDWIQELRRAGLLLVENRHPTSNEYHFLKSSWMLDTDATVLEPVEPTQSGDKPTQSGDKPTQSSDKYPRNRVTIPTQSGDTNRPSSRPIRTDPRTNPLSNRPGRPDRERERASQPSLARKSG